MKAPVSPRQISRRRFVGLSLTALSATIVGSVGVLSRGHWERIGSSLAWLRGAHLSAAQRIERHFHYLDLDPEGVRAFVRDYTKHRGEITRFSEPREDIFERYLLSTDFFRNGADESRPVRYVLFFDPYVSPCWNPCHTSPHGPA